MNRLSIVIVNYNVKSYLEQALSSIQTALKNIPSEIFVVDNASSDGSVQMVKKHFPSVYLIENKDNPGFAKANNQAIQKATGEYICLINPDTLVREDTFSKCLEYMDEHPDTGMAGCKILNADGTLQLACRRSFPTPWVALTKVTGLSTLFPKSRLFARYNLTYLDPDKTSEVEAISGSFMFARKKTIDEIGHLDENFFMYGEDLDWCYRIQKAGWKIVYLPSTQIIHYKGRSTFEASFDQLNVFYRAMQLFVQKHFQKGWIFLPQWFLLLGIWMRGGLSFLYSLLQRMIIPFIDLVFLQAGLILGILIRFGNLEYWIRYRTVNVIYSIIWLVCLFSMGLYRKKVFSASKTLGAVVFGFFLNTSLTFFLPQYAFSRLVILFSTLLNTFLLIGWRIGIRLASRVHWLPFLGTVGKSLGRRRAAIAGTGPSSIKVWEKLRNQFASGYDLVGLLALDSKVFEESRFEEISVLGLFDDLERIAKVHKLHEIIVPPDALSYHQILNGIARTRSLHLDFKMVPREVDVLIGRSSVDQLDEIPLMDLDYTLFTGINPFLKRSLDVVLSLILLPFFIMIRLINWLHPRMEMKSETIRDARGESMHIRIPYFNNLEMKNIFGKLHYLGHVLLGSLSLVGAEMVSSKVDVQPIRYKPGLTGLTQLNLWRNLTPEDKEHYDLYYLKNYTILLDFEIILRTLMQMPQGR